MEGLPWPWGREGKDSSPSDLTPNWDYLGQGDRCPLCSLHGSREGHAVSASQGIRHRELEELVKNFIVHTKLVLNY